MAGGCSDHENTKLVNTTCFPAANIHSDLLRRLSQASIQASAAPSDILKCLGFPAFASSQIAHPHLIDSTMPAPRQVFVAVIGMHILPNSVYSQRRDINISQVPVV
jgi:hypothetical protein